MLYRYRWKRLTRNKYRRQWSARKRSICRTSWRHWGRKRIATAWRPTAFWRLPTSFVVWIWRSGRATTSGGTRAAAGYASIDMSRSSTSRGASRTTSKPRSVSTFASGWAVVVPCRVTLGQGVWQVTARCVCCTHAAWTSIRLMSSAPDRCKTSSTSSEAGLHTQVWINCSPCSSLSGVVG